MKPQAFALRTGTQMAWSLPVQKGLAGLQRSQLAAQAAAPADAAGVSLNASQALRCAQRMPGIEGDRHHCQRLAGHGEPGAEAPRAERSSAPSSRPRPAHPADMSASISGEIIPHLDIKKLGLSSIR